MDKLKEGILFETMLKWLIEDKNITERDVFRLAFMSVCGRNPQRAKELKDNCLKKLGRENAWYDFLEGYMAALCDEVVEKCAYALSASAQVGQAVDEDTATP